ncbi:hypothetical protein [Novacetimonas maltaceti]|uniref:hypothetical protein n=1 Tax=Novacetimonas maltaceti TaxID=1203393 RepID=UPI0011AF48A4|nr:hypothetical protein [Novacetimonas maltaceti]
MTSSPGGHSHNAHPCRDGWPGHLWRGPGYAVNAAMTERRFRGIDAVVGAVEYYTTPRGRRPGSPNRPGPYG